MAPAEIDFTVYPDECDSYGHLNQASFLALFERARWEMLARGPGMDFFTRQGSWPAVRKTTVEYHAPAFPGDVLRFSQVLVHLGRTSFTLRQTARRLRDDALVATAELVFVCVDAAGPPGAGTRGAAAGHGRPAARPATSAGSRSTASTSPSTSGVRGRPSSSSTATRWITRSGSTRSPTSRAGCGSPPISGGWASPTRRTSGYSMATYADDLLALLNTLGVDRVVLCGFSMGGYVAFEMLRRAPGTGCAAWC